MPAVDDRGQGEYCSFGIADHGVVRSVIYDTSIGLQMFALWCCSIMIQELAAGPGLLRFREWYEVYAIPRFRSVRELRRQSIQVMGPDGH